MKKTLLILAVAFLGLELWAQVPALPTNMVPRRLPRYGLTNGPSAPPRFPQAAPRPTFPPIGGAPGATPAPAPDAKSPALANASSEEIIPAGTINFQGVDVGQVLDIYAQLVGRTLLRAGLPNATIVLKTETPLTKSEAIQALQAVLALNGIAVVNVGDKFVKVGPVDAAGTFGAEFNTNSASALPDLGSYVTRIVQLKYVKPTEMQQIIAPFAKIPNSILPIDSNGILVLRDNAENVKRMLEMIDRIDVSVPDEIVSEVIPIRYAEAADIATALNSLGGSGTSAVSFGGSSSSSTINGLRGGTSGGINSMSGASGINGLNSGFGGGARPYAASTTRLGSTMGGLNGTPTSGSTFQSRLQNIINRATGASSGGGGSQDQIQIFGETKIIADQRSNSLLVFANRADMERIKEVVSKLDVLLSQVLIESIIMDVGLGNTLTAGVSAKQNPKQFNNSNVAGGGAALNGGGSSFLGTLASLATNGTSSFTLPTNALSGGLNYFGNIGDTWDIAVNAAQSDNNASIIQRPRIQTSQAKPAQFFVGETVPYVNSTYNNAYSGGYGGSSYSQLSVGVELDVTPFINPDGLVVMDIQQEIDEISGYTAIDNNKVPNTIKRTLSTEIAVKNRDTVILGGFVRSDKSHSVSGVPILMDIPLLGWLFRSTDNSRNRTELIVLMRPTVLKTPEIAAAQTIKEAQRLPGISAAAAENAAEERRLINAERKKELKNAKKGGPADGFFNMKPGEEGAETNAPLHDFGSAPHPQPQPAQPAVDVNPVFDQAPPVSH